MKETNRCVHFLLGAYNMQLLLNTLYYFCKKESPLKTHVNS